MKKIILSLTLCCCFFMTQTSATTTFNCPPPANVTQTSNTSRLVAFDWDDCGSCINNTFNVFYIKDGVTSQTFTTTQSNIAFTNLAPGLYEFHFQRACGITTSTSIIITDMVDG